MNTKRPLPNPWPYFRQLERQISDVAEVVSLTQANAAAFGDKLSELIVVIGSEIDSNLRLYTGRAKGGIQDYLNQLKSTHPRFTEACFRVAGLDPDVPFHPFPSFSKSPDWWKSYNEIKHNRYVKGPAANIATLMMCFAGLYHANLYVTVETPFFPQGYESLFVEDLVGLHAGKRGSGLFQFTDRDRIPNYYWFGHR